MTNHRLRLGRHVSMGHRSALDRNATIRHHDEPGWRVDGLRKMATLGVESHCSSLGKNTKD